MNLNKKYILELTKQYAIYVFAFLFVAAMASCSSDDDDKIDGTAYVKLGIREKGEDKLVDENYEYSTNYTAVSSVSYFMFSNLPEWTIETEKPEDAAWAEIWPKEGKKDGRFYLKIYQNMLYEERSTIINIKYKGVVYKSFKVTQTAGVATIGLSMTSVTSSSSSNRNFLITVTTNTSGWIATADVTWLRIVKQTDTQLGMQIDEYPEGQTEDRKAVVTVSSVDDPNVKATFTVTQKLPTN